MIIYCLFFLDDKNQLRQGYLQIKDKNNEDKIINALKEYESLHILLNNKIYIDNKELFYHSDTLNYDLLIFQYDNDKYKDIIFKSIQNRNLICCVKIKKNTRYTNGQGFKIKGLENNDSENQIKMTNEKGQIINIEFNNSIIKNKKKKNISFNNKHLENKNPNSIRHCKEAGTHFIKHLPLIPPQPLTQVYS